MLFEHSHSPQNDSTEELQKLFNIHSGGGRETMRLQIQTFKALCEHARFDSVGRTNSGDLHSQVAVNSNSAASKPAEEMPPIHIALHIHLPENKTSRDYEAIIQDIGRYIYGKRPDAN